jgi:hypothetical protein
MPVFPGKINSKTLKTVAVPFMTTIYSLLPFLPKNAAGYLHYMEVTVILDNSRFTIIYSLISHDKLSTYPVLLTDVDVFIPSVNI